MAVASLPVQAITRQAPAKIRAEKRLREAAEAVANTSNESNGGSQPSSPVFCAYVDHLQSPMAAYFGGSECNLSNTLRAESPLGNVTNSQDNVPITPKAFHLNANCSDLPSRVCKGSGLPFKSPMSAFFDGDDSWESIMLPESDIGIMSCCSTASFNSNVSASTESTYSAASPGGSCMAPSPGSSCVVSPPVSSFMGLPIIVQMVSPCFVSCNTAAGAPQCQSFDLPMQSVLQSPEDLCHAPCEMKSAVHMVPRDKVRHVSWKGEVAEIREVSAKASLCLADLVEWSNSDGSLLAGRVWQLSQDSQGTFEVQEALDGCSNEEERTELVAELIGHSLEAARCPHANHVLRKVITLMPPSALNFIVVELMSQGSHGIIELARHRYGCRIIEGLIAHCPFEQMRGMVETLLADASALCMHMFGNFVMQRLLEKSSSASHSQLFQVMHPQLAAMGTNFDGSRVLVKAMTYGTNFDGLGCPSNTSC